LNLAIVYLRTKRDAELGALLERINPESLPSHSHSLRAAAYYVQGLQAFFGARYNEAKYVRYSLNLLNLREVLYLHLYEFTLLYRYKKNERDSESMRYYALLA